MSKDLVPVENLDGTGWHLEPPKPACPVREAAAQVVATFDVVLLVEDGWGEDAIAAMCALSDAIEDNPHPCPTCHDPEKSRKKEPILAAAAEHLRYMAQDAYMIDGKYLPDGWSAMTLADDLEKMTAHDPCPRCNGRGYVQTGDTGTDCPECGG